MKTHGQVRYAKDNSTATCHPLKSTEIEVKNIALSNEFIDTFTRIILQLRK
ncbi:MAG TPA: hypothetical protein HA258_05425 [Thermoplasmata archaeon]|nr:hypothetical protein [Thermoplasmata archaeon]